MSDTPCSSDESTEHPPQLYFIPPELVTDDCIDISPMKNRSVFKRVLREGTGREPHKGDKVFVHYTGTLPDGTKFDSSRDRNTEFSFDLGSGKVIKSWELCVRSMKKGEECMLVTSAKYAYGENGHGEVIPPNSALCFNIELIDFHGEDVTPEKNRLVLRSMISRGSGYLVPRDFSDVRVSYTAMVNGEIMDEKDDFEYQVGRAEEHNLPEGFDLAVRYMLKGEKALFLLKYPLSCRVYETDDVSDYPYDYEVEYTITLHDFKQVKQFYDMDCEEKLSMVATIKERGNFFLNLKCYNTSLRWYENGKKYVEDWDVSPDSPIPAEQLEARNQFMTSLYLNISLAKLRLGCYSDTIAAANDACKIDPKSNKAHFRAAKAHCELREYDLALGRLKLAGECGANVVEITREMQRMTLLRQQYKAEERSLYKNALSKLMATPDTNGA